MSETLQFVPVVQDDPLTQPLLTELAAEYAQRYGGAPQAVLTWLRDYPAAEFSPPDGGWLIGVLNDVPVTGGGFRRFDAETAELKRIWTDRAHRRCGLAAALLAELEAAITARGYRRIYLMTGDRQPEAEALYHAAGYTRLAEPLPSTEPVYPVAFAKELS
ncbi:GNAT family acetyltransferase [Mycobacterium kyorinense]|uniref:GNAT family acetyltransferase n=1 Tax=Mycobacterium kyorinense TaxID=487514 RepID=A0A1A2Z2H9_9MYCO|nr:GNAT family N-acetyltransferase [Mycobacterium kyorinense]OBI43702.1 GNAT family acetyltransferase [Mycobacterium kyorinense]